MLIKSSLITVCFVVVESFISFFPKQIAQKQSKISDLSNYRPRFYHYFDKYSIPDKLFNSKVDDFVVKGMPNKLKFQEFFKKSKVSVTGLISKESFIQYEQIQQMMRENLIFAQDIDDLWLSSVGDSSGLDENEAYELLCMIFDLPDPEDVQFIDSEFKSLTKSKSELVFSKFLIWNDIQDILDEEALSMEEVTELWKNVAGDLNTPIDLLTFRKLNHLLDMKLENVGNITEKDLISKQIQSVENNDKVQLEDPLNFFDFETLTDFKTFFESQMSSDRKISFDSIKSWSDIKDMISDGVIDMSDVSKAWSKVAPVSASIEYDDFLKFNVYVDLMMKNDKDENDSKKEESSKNESEVFYRNEFQNLMRGSSLMPFEILLQWKEIEELLKDDVISEKQINVIFDSFAEPIGIPQTGKGISVDSFVKLNQIIDSSLDSSSVSQSQTNTNKNFDAFQSLPEYAQNELLKSSNETESSTTATQSEIDMMTMLDSAENLLNAGSFDEFSSLIGDDTSLIDEKLLNIPKGGTSDSDLNTAIDKLISLSKNQKKCGLEDLSETDGEKLLELFQQVLAKLEPPLVEKYEIGDIKMKLNGNWKLLYTNSEMFKFYSGLTGFNNVFPATKFSDLSLEYSTDGFSNELKYYETLTNPFGKLIATVFGTWDLVRETSFMTNKVSVIMRSFCTKVTAGPATYEAQENWKSLRTLSMNELLYVDDRVLLMRNCGAIKIFFVLVKNE